MCWASAGVAWLDLSHAGKGAGVCVQEAIDVSPSPLSLKVNKKDIFKSCGFIGFYWVVVFHVSLGRDTAIWRFQFAWQLAVADTCKFSWSCTLKYLGSFDVGPFHIGWDSHTVATRFQMSCHLCILLVKASYETFWIQENKRLIPLFHEKSRIYGIF